MEVEWASATAWKVYMYLYDINNLLLLYICGINLISFLVFFGDKEAAKLDIPRIPEATLLALALFGGTIGAIVGQRVLRHKTRKELFRTQLYCIVGLHILVALVIFVAAARGIIPVTR